MPVTRVADCTSDSPAFLALPLPANFSPRHLQIRDKGGDDGDDDDKMDDEISSPSLLPLLYPLPHILTALYLSPFLSTSVPYLPSALSAYALFSLLASLLGLIGLRARSSTCLFIYSHHLFLDVFLSLLPQLALLAVVHEFATSGGACDATTVTIDADKSWGKFVLPRFGKGIGWCGAAMLALQGVLAALVVVGGVAQWRAAMGLRRLACRIEGEEKRTVEAVRTAMEEKRQLEKR